MEHYTNAVATVPDTSFGGTRSKYFSREETETLSALVERALMLAEDAKAAKEAHAAAVDRVRAWMQDNEHTLVECDSWRVSRKQCEGRETLDREAMAAAGINLQRFIAIGEPYETLRITRRTAKARSRVAS